MADNKLDGSTADVLLNDLNDFKNLMRLYITHKAPMIFVK